MEDLFKKYKYPNLDRFYKYLKEDNIEVTKKQVKDFLDAQASKQVVTQTKQIKSKKNSRLAKWSNKATVQAQKALSLAKSVLSGESTSFIYTSTPEDNKSDS